MTPIRYQNDELWIERLSVSSLLKKFQTPFYVYSKAALLYNARVWLEAVQGLPALVCFALKANDNLHLINLFGKKGFGADVVSGGELFLARKAGIPAERIVFAGVGKQDFEIRQALREGIRTVNVESEAELELVQRIAGELNRRAPVHFRLNPDIDAHSHPYITTGLQENKFGLDTSQALRLFRRAATMPNISPEGIHVHVGSQITDLEPFRECGRAIREFYQRLQREGIKVRSIDLGGGLGVDYGQVLQWPPAEETPEVPTVGEYIGAILDHLGDLPVRFVFEPGRSLIANAGLLITRIVYIKSSAKKKFVIVDAGMNDLIRPALYQAYHRILPVVRPIRQEREAVDIVGPICESADFFARNRLMPTVAAGEALAILSAGAYGYSLSSNYNGRPRRAEILVDGDQAKVIRRAERYEDLLALYDSDLPEV